MTALSAHDLRKVAVEAEVDPRTVRKYVDGVPVKGMAADRIARALASLGFEAGGANGASATVPAGAVSGGGRAEKGALFIVVTDTRRILVSLVEALVPGMVTVRVRTLKPTAAHADKKWTPINGIPVASLRLPDEARDRSLLQEARRFPAPGARVVVRT